ncbi:MAG: hypothetical protein FWG97_00575 [Deltaproteobacteria bacterium]|nr:hypothetical protein [Deltaproteobacteria bacterium]
MNTPAKPEPILLIGINSIAKALGVSLSRVRGVYLKRRDFPARKEREGGPWITTRKSLAAWAEGYVSPRQEPR